MAQVIKIEIPVEVTDNTEPALSGISGKLSKMEQAMLKLDKAMKSFGKSKMEQRMDNEADRALAEMEEEAAQLDKMTIRPEIEVEDHATEVINDVEDRLSAIEGDVVDAEIGADDNASQIVSAAQDAIENFSGSSGSAEIGADDNASQIVRAAEDAVEEFSGSSGSAEIGVNDTASSMIDSVKDKLSALEGMAVSAVVGAADTASGVIDSVRDKLSAIGGYAVSAVVGAVDTASAVIDSVRDKASAWAGTTWNATVGIVDTATAPLQGIANMAKNPIMQAGTMLGITVGLNDTVNTFKDFESMMSQVSAISGATGSDFDALTAKAKEMGANTKFTAAESAEAFNYMAMAGWKTDDMLGGIEGIMNLAAASGESLGSTSDIVTDALTAFGLSASDSGHFADVLAQASANANTNVGMLGESFKHVAPVAGAMNYSIEDTSLALGLMANASIKGSMAGTALKTSLANMASPTDSMAEAMEKYGISLTDSEGNMKSLGGVIENLRSSLGGLSETEQTAAASTIFGKEAMAGMLAIINASEDDYKKLSAAIYDADGAAQRMSDTMLDNLEGSLTLMQSAVDGVKSSFGERLSPYIRGVADAITESMPAAEIALTKFMDTFDSKIDHMVNSEAWADAGLFGKVNIAWNTMIGEPFLEWAKSEGGHVISKGFGTLFSEAAKVLPGGEEAGIASWFSLGLLAKGTTTAVNGVRKLAGVLGDFSPAAGKFGIAAAAVTAGVAAIAMAVDNYNQKRIDESLTDHFGNIALSAKQIKDFAGQIVDADFSVNIHTSLGNMDGADEMREKAEEALRANDALEWKCSIGLELSEGEQQSYTSNIETFITSKKTELEEQFSGVGLAINAVIDEENSTDLIEALGTWYEIDSSELEGLSSQLTAAVEAALEDGIIEVNEQGAINRLQNKINTILSSWNESKSQTQLDMIKQKYGHLTGKDLTDGTFQEIIASYQEQRMTQKQELDALSEQYYDLINSAYGEGRLDDAGVKDWKDRWLWGAWQKQGSSLANALEFEGNTLRDTYGSEITSNLEDSAGRVSKGINNQINPLFASGEAIDLSDLHSYLDAGVTNQMGNASGALKELYSYMKPDVAAMGALIDDYRNVFGSVPKNLLDSYNEAIEIGAASGDESAALQLYANRLLEQGSDQVKDALTNPDNALYESIRNSIPGLGDAVDRALAEEGDSIEIDDMMAQIKGMELENENEVGRLLDSAAQKALANAVVESGSAVEISAEGIQVTLGDVEVDGQSAIEQVASAIGITADKLAQANGYDSAVEVPVGATIIIPPELCEADPSGLTSAIEQAAKEATADPVKTEQPVNTTYTQGDTDTSQIEEQAQEDIEKEAINAEQPVDTKYTQGEIDDSELQESVKEPESKDPLPAEYPVDITYILGETNIESVLSEAEAEVINAFSTPLPADSDVSLTMTHANSAGEVGRIYGEVDSEVRGKFGAGFSASADVAVTLNWHITNPVAGISVSAGGGTATATIAGVGASAEGRYVDAPMLSLIGEDGPEFVIPVGAKRRARGIELWQQAGEMLGVPMHAEGGIFSGSGLGTGRKYSSDDFEEGKDVSEGKIDVTIPDSEKGNVTIQVSMSPEFKISNEKPADIIQMIKSQLKDMTDDLAYLLAEKLTDSFSNRPI